MLWNLLMSKPRKTVLVSPLPADKCPMPEGLRVAFEAGDPEVNKTVDPALLAHRDFIYNEYLVLPMEL